MNDRHGLVARVDARLRAADELLPVLTQAAEQAIDALPCSEDGCLYARDRVLEAAWSHIHGAAQTRRRVPPGRLISEIEAALASAARDCPGRVGWDASAGDTAPVNLFDAQRELADYLDVIPALGDAALAHARELARRYFAPGTEEFHDAVAEALHDLFAWLSARDRRAGSTVNVDRLGGYVHAILSNGIIRGIRRANPQWQALRDKIVDIAEGRCRGQRLFRWVDIGLGQKVIGPHPWDVERKPWALAERAAAWREPRRLAAFIEQQLGGCDPVPTDLPSAFPPAGEAISLAELVAHICVWCDTPLTAVELTNMVLACLPDREPDGGALSEIAAPAFARLEPDGEALAAIADCLVEYMNGPRPSPARALSLLLHVGGMARELAIEALGGVAEVLARLGLPADGAVSTRVRAEVPHAEHLPDGATYSDLMAFPARVPSIAIAMVLDDEGIRAIDCSPATRKAAQDRVGVLRFRLVKGYLTDCVRRKLGIDPETTE